MEPSKKPLNFNEVCVRLKNNIEYRGRMAGCDNYMNLVLEDVSEYMSDKPTVKYGPLILRGRFILHICVRQPE
jgi:small nuclear ribonucleoprotein